MSLKSAKTTLHLAVLVLLLSTVGWSQAPSQMSGFPFETGVLYEGIGETRVVDLDGDGQLEIIVPTYQSGAYVFQSDGTIRPGWPVLPILTPFIDSFRRKPLVGDIDGDGELDIVIGGFYVLYAFDADGTPKPGWPLFDVIRRDHLALADLDGDGDDEIIGYPELSGNDLLAVHGDGSVVDGWPVTIPNQPPGLIGKVDPAVADLDLDGDDEVIVTGSFAYFGTVYPSLIYVFDGDGTVLPGWPVTPPGPGPRHADAAAVGDLDGDGVPEIVTAGVNSHHAFRADGSPFFPNALITPGSGARPIAIVDLDGDGNNEIVTQDLTIRVITNEGLSFYQTAPLDFVAMSIADINGDGQQEILAKSYEPFYSLHAYTPTLQPVPGFPIELEGNFFSQSRDSTTVADIDGDGDIEVVLVSNNETGQWARLHVLDLPNPGPLPATVAWPTRGFDGRMSFDFHSDKYTRFLRGDANGDTDLDVADAVTLLGVLFLGAATDCPEAIDANGDGANDVSDSVYLLAYLFLDGEPLPYPFPECARVALSVHPVCDSTCP